MTTWQLMIVELAVAEPLYYSARRILDMDLGVSMKQCIVDVKDVQAALLGRLVQSLDVF
jgi:hypothetical protein